MPASKLPFGLQAIPFLAQIYQVHKPQGNGLCTHEILMLDHQLSYLPAYFQGEFSLYGSSWGGFLATKGRDLTETEDVQNVMKWILITT